MHSYSAKISLKQWTASPVVAILDIPIGLRRRH